MEQNLNKAQLANKEYNLSQTDVGHPLKTLKGSVIRRSRFGIGKLIGSHLYFFKAYASYLLDDQRMIQLREMTEQCPFDFNCIRYNIQTREICLMECPDFNEAREPRVGRVFSVDSRGRQKPIRDHNQIYHHKWEFVKDEYKGFNVKQSWEWSRTWLSILTEPANGSNKVNWTNQLKRFGLFNLQ